MNDEPLFVIDPTPAARIPVRSNRVGFRLGAAAAAAGLAVGLAVGAVMNHHRGAPARTVTATSSK